MASRINPTLFDKLVADLEIDGLHPDGESRTSDPGRAAMRFYTAPKIERFNEAALRATVLRELNWLLNTINLESVEDLAPYPQVATSVLNYGVRDMAGKMLDRRAVQGRAREIREALLRYEPRLDREHLDVEAAMATERPNSVTFVIRGDVTSAVHALPVEIKTDVEIDSGAVVLRD